MAAGWEKLNAEPAETAEKQISACSAVSALIFLTWRAACPRIGP